MGENSRNCLKIVAKKILNFHQKSAVIRTSKFYQLCSLKYKYITIYKNKNINYVYYPSEVL